MPQRFSFRLLVTALIACDSVACAAELTRDQRLIVACHRLDVDGVVVALREGADVDARFGEDGDKVFLDPWVNGWPVAAKAWTPLIALANASDYPDPPRKVLSTFEDRQWALDEQKKIPADQIEQRRRAMLTIAMVLLSHKPDIDADDGYGGTALYSAVDGRKLELAKLLLRHNAKVNTKTGIYIDGPGNITPLHQAFWSAELTKLLLEKGADPKATDSEGRTPAHWAR